MIFSLLKSRGGLFFIAGIFYCLNASAGNKVESAGTTSAIYSSAESNHHDPSKFFERKTKIQNIPHFKKEVRGTVKDSSGILANVSVYVKNQPNIGTTTDQNGKYLLDVPDENSI